MSASCNAKSSLPLLGIRANPSTGSSSPCLTLTKVVRRDHLLPKINCAHAMPIHIHSCDLLFPQGVLFRPPFPRKSTGTRNRAPCSEVTPLPVAIVKQGVMEEVKQHDHT